MMDEKEIIQLIEAEQARRDRQAGDHLIRKEEARRMLGGPDPSTLWRWEKAGYLTPVKIGVKVFYRQSDIAGIIKEKTTQKHTQL